MTRFVVVTGTDTGVGKTFVTGMLVERLRRSTTALALKPVETGWDEPSSDAAKLAEASGRPLAMTIAHHFALPAAPKVASEVEGAQPLELGPLVGWIREMAAGADLCLVEGAGGWLVPWAGDLMLSDVAASLEASLLIVARAGLGTINHSLLTAQVARQTAPVAAIALSKLPDESIAAAESNAREIERGSGIATLILPRDLDRLARMFHVERPTPRSS